MTTRTIYGFVASGAVVLAFVLAYFFGDCLLQNPSQYAATVDVGKEFKAEQFISIAESANIAFTSLNVGLFLIVGFALSKREALHSFSFAEILSLTLFVIFSFMVFYVSFWLRSDLLSNLGFSFETEVHRRSAFLFSRRTLSIMAVATALSSAAALFFAASSVGAIFEKAQVEHPIDKDVV